MFGSELIEGYEPLRVYDRKVFTPEKYCYQYRNSCRNQAAGKCESTHYMEICPNRDPQFRAGFDPNHGDLGILSWHGHY